jgi:glycosyltransferase involved in cell wall biosynthesis
VRIAQVAPVWERVPPVRYGGIELVVSLLTEELVRRGHDVTLFASGDSITTAKLESVYRTARRAEMGSTLTDIAHVSHAFDRADSFDIIQNHAGYLGVALARQVGTPVLTTLHGIFTEKNSPFFERFGDACFYNSISDEQRRQGPEGMNYVGTIYNGIRVESYPYREDKGDFFVNVSRISPLKGTHVACEMAHKAGVRLIIAGKIDAGSDTRYFEEKVEPLLDSDQVIYLGEVSEAEKRRLFAEAKGFLFPLQWDEPFGLVLAEAMACGTPVLSLARGSVPEVVVDGETGFVVGDVDELMGCLSRTGEIDPKACRARAESRFGVKRMTDDYEAAYEKILSGRGEAT